MASRSSGLFGSEYYVGTRRGRADAFDMGFEMFPEKYEATEIWEDPDQLREDRRETLKDFTPDNSRLFAHEEPRRNTYAKDRLNLRDGGARVTTDPYANEDFDTSFHDKDPRGWNTEQPWDEYRRNMEAQLRRIDFKDDGDYSTTGGGIHPNTLYRQIRGAQNWVKDRLKIFETSYTNRHTGGVGVYPEVSKVFKSEYEDASHMMDGSMATTFEDPINRSRATMRLSNMIGGGSKSLRANTTTDHKVLVAAYGKLLGYRGHLNHETQLRLTEDDTRYSAVEGLRTGVPAPVVKLMSSKVEGATAAAVARSAAQDQLSPAAAERFRGMRYDESTQGNRNSILTREIMTLLGITENELKLLDSKASSNNKQAMHAIARLYEMAEAVHKAPAHMKLHMRDELLLRSAGQGLIPGAGREVQEAVVVNPKIIQFMDQMTRKTETPGISGVDAQRSNAIADPERRLIDRSTPVLVFKSRSRDTDDIMVVQTSTETGHEMPTAIPTASYKNLARSATREAKNREKAITTQIFSRSGQFVYGQTPTPAGDILAQAMDTEIDNEFGENKALTRHVGRFGDKHAGRYQQREYYTPTQAEVENPGRKNAKNNNHLAH
jgi:hypothetical protein